jgi:phage tail protein X
MRVSIWSYDSNPLVDPRLYKQSLTRCEESVTAGFLRWINPADKSKGCVTTPPRATCNLGDEALVSASHETSVAASITEAEMQANVGIAKTAGGVLRAQLKVKAWIHPSTADGKAPLPRGSWINLAGLEVVAVQ